MMNESTEDFSLPVTCRPDKSQWFGVPIFGALGLLVLILPFFTPLAPPPAKPPSKLEIVAILAMTSALGLIILVAAIWGALWLLRGIIIADETGLRWRSIKKWHHTTWPQVGDYYEDTLRSKRATVETDGGKLEIADATIGNAVELRAVIQHHAQWARVREWGILGTRGEADWPRTFGYNPTEQLSNSRICCVIAFVWFFGFLWGFCYRWNDLVEVWKYSGPALPIIGATLYFIWMLLYPFVALTWLLMLRETRSRITERITVSTTGLIFEDNARRVECAWEEISDYYRDPMLPANSGDDRYVVVTANGTFDFTLIENRLLLGEIIKRHATNALYQHWRDYRPQQETGKKGERLYTYRAKETRALVLLPMAFVPISIILIFAVPSMNPENSSAAEDLGFKILMGLYGLGSIVLCAAYFLGSIEISKNGITQRTLLGQRFLTWQDITQLRRNYLGVCQVVGRDKRLSFWGLIADGEILRDEITRRAVNAEIAPSWTETKKS